MYYKGVKTLWVYVLIGLDEGNKGESVRSKHIGYLGCELKYNGYFEWDSADRLGQFTELASYAYIYLYIYKGNRVSINQPPAN